MTIISKKSTELGSEEIINICKLKDTHWKHGYNEQEDWFKTNILEDDIHNLLYFDKQLVGYTALRSKISNIFDSKIMFNPKTLIYDTYIIKEGFRHKGHGIELLRFNIRIIKNEKACSFLICENNIIDFYKMYDWSLLGAHQYKTFNRTVNSNVMFINCSDIVFENEISQLNFQIYF